MVSNHVQKGNYAGTPVDQEDAKAIFSPCQRNIKDLCCVMMVLHVEVILENLESLTFRPSTRPSKTEPGR